MSGRKQPAISADVAALIAAVGGHSGDNEAFPMAAIAQREKQRKKEQEAAKSIYLGEYTPADDTGKSLGVTFKVFAAPEDLDQKLFTYSDARYRLAELKDWHGFDGTPYRNHKDLYAAIKKGEYGGGWIIPTIDLLAIIEANKYKKPLKETFGEEVQTITGPGCWYWSCNENSDSTVALYDLKSSQRSKTSPDIWAYSCRPVRLVPTK